MFNELCTHLLSYFFSIDSLQNTSWSLPRAKSFDANTSAKVVVGTREFTGNFVCRQLDLYLTLYCT
jgi:hypothetical protein